MAVVTNISKRQTSEKVYNLEVLGDESYTVNRLMVHNCRGRYTRVNTTFYKMANGKLTLKTADEILAEKGVRR